MSLAFWEVQLRHTDIVIAGGGLAGSIAAAMLGRAGIDAVLVDPHPSIRRTSAAKARRRQISDAAEDRSRRSSAAGRNARSGMLGGALRPRCRETAGRSARHSLRHTGQYHPRRRFRRRRIRPRQGHDIATSADGRPSAVERRGDFGALVVLANGLNIGFRHKLGMTRDDISECHSIIDRFRRRTGRTGRAFRFPSLTYFARAPIQPHGLYHAVSDWRRRYAQTSSAIAIWTIPGYKQFRETPRETLLAMLPGLRPLLGNFTVPGSSRSGQSILCDQGLPAGRHRPCR